MNSQGRLIGISIVAAAFACLLWQARQAQAQGPQPQTPAVALGTAFSYQGQLKRDGSRYTGVCDFQFSLWSALSGGVQQGLVQNLNGVEVNNGLFSVALDFGTQFKGEARWLATAVQCAGDIGFTTLAPRTELGPVPYALTLAPGAVLSSTGTLGLQVNTPNGNAIVGRSRANGYATIFGGDTYASNFGGGYGYGVYGSSLRGYGVYGKSYGYRTSCPVPGICNTILLHGVRGDSTTGQGVVGTSTTGDGVYGTSSLSNCFGYNDVCETMGGVWGSSVAGTGVYGNGGSRGVYGFSTNNWGIYGSKGIGLAGYFNGPVDVLGTLSKTAGSFKIDHPLDPANKYLSHSFAESPDMLDIYSGNITTDGNGDAVVVLPAYFEALNRDFRYQLRALGTFAQAIVATKVRDNRFTIKTDKPFVDVSWQVTGIRKDPYAETYRIVAEEDKPEKERGLYQFPELYGEPAEKGINYAGNAAMPTQTGGTK